MYFWCRAVADCPSSLQLLFTESLSKGTHIFIIIVVCLERWRVGRRGRLRREGLGVASRITSRFGMGGRRGVGPLAWAWESCRNIMSRLNLRVYGSELIRTLKICFNGSPHPVGIVLVGYGPSHWGLRKVGGARLIGMSVINGRRGMVVEISWGQMRVWRTGAAC